MIEKLHFTDTDLVISLWMKYKWNYGIIGHILDNANKFYLFEICYSYC